MKIILVSQILVVNLEDRRRLKSDDSNVRTEKEVERLQKEFDEIDKVVDEQRMRIEVNYQLNK